MANDKKAKNAKKIKVPSKQTLNLLVKEKTLAHPTRLIPILLLIALGSYAFAKFAVIDRLNKVRHAEAELAVMYNQLEMIESTYADFDEVQSEYNRYTYENYDRTLADRLEVLAMIERQLFPVGSVQNISISGRTVSLILTGPSLADASGIIASLLSDPLVEEVNIPSYTENSDKTGANSTIPMTITLKDATTIAPEEEFEEMVWDTDEIGSADTDSSADEVESENDDNADADNQDDDNIDADSSVGADSDETDGTENGGGE